MLKDFNNKCINLYQILKERGITNIILAYDCNSMSYSIIGFGYVDIITQQNIDIHLNDIDKYYEKWYCRWVDAFCDELKDNRNDNSGGY